MSILTCCVPPSSSLPPVRSLRTASEDTIITALHSLQALYCPLRLPITLPKGKEAASAPADSGYVSEDENEVAPLQRRYSTTEDAFAALRADAYEKDFAVRWLTSLIARASELPFGTEEAREKAVDDAAFILSSFSDSPTNEEDEALTRDFSFSTSRARDITIQINDAPLTGTDHTDVGLQSWGASIVFSGLMCEAPERFGLDVLPENASIIELGAGTALISLTLGKLLPSMGQEAQILATDYHNAVLENARTNIATNFGSENAPVDAMLLDWATPPPALAASASLLFAADVVYAPEHAAWLRDCAAHILAPEGTFWLVVTVRSHGKFDGIPDTAETAFEDFKSTWRNGRVLRIVKKEMLDKKRGVGRGDEKGYMLFKIGWVDA
ncbi:uncharacterized protein N0V89_001816 [Didymosphaeria variabile]|uniref:S-adenosyl-L-methionine-dependent methyltransferase n=1 Tax=Didymosphaeria variabile TaxID=1932322 RepID=A0A9W8XQZ4_9PLEO|nr:uncharacterized protein N0V89_001816 [Didymosphaeria variabile]KAJ4357241.1 hypothetical protein N0V89_001816 [Didymosphaeria variabile]